MKSSFSHSSKQLCLHRVATCALLLLQYLFPALIVALFCAVCFRAGGLYPFGSKSVSWCDMDTQIVPLLCNLKDVLNGKASLLISFENGGGMDFLGIFFYYLSSPFHLLVAFVKKADMMQFVNVLVALKLMAAGTTAYLYFRKSMPTLSPVIALALSVFYAFCGYGAIYYQILLWLDALYLFPLLVLGVERLLKKQKPALYIVVLTASFLICFYLSYMCVLFLLLFVGGKVLALSKEKRGEVCTLFITSSVVSVFLAAVGIIPLLSQWTASARTSVSFWQTLTSAPLQGNIESTLPVLFSSLALLPFFLFKKPRREDLPYLAVALLVFLPAVIEPINVIWQTGTYMAFPIRYGFITNFMLLVPVGRALVERKDGFLSVFSQPNGKTACKNAPKSKKAPSKALLNGLKIALPAAVSIAAICMVVRFFTVTETFLTKNAKDLANFSRKLWGTEQSLALFASYFWVALTLSLVLVLLYKTRLLKPIALGASVLLFSFASGYFTANAYLSLGAANKSFYDKAIAIEGQVESLSKDLNFYRVKQTRKNYYVNYTGAAGYGSFSTYTSLTSKNSMDLAKILGYESNWMEIGSHNGTVFTDALLCTRYITYYTTVGKTPAGDPVYGYDLQKTPYYMPLGIVTDTNLTEYRNIFYRSRTEYQERLFNALFPSAGNLITEYGYTYLQNVEDAKEGELYRFYPKAKSEQSLIVYEIAVEERQTLYLDVFHEAAFNLVQPTFDTLSVKVDGRTVASPFPTGDNNGFLTLGTYENRTVTVELVLKKRLEATSFGVFGISREAMNAATSGAISANMQVKGNTLRGGVNAHKGQYLFLSLPYEQGYNARVNGKSVDLFRTLDGFCALPLTEGVNEIEIVYRPWTLILGALGTLIGTGLLFVLVAFYDKLRYNKIIGKVATYATVAASGLCLVAVYLLPLLIHFLI